MLKPQSNNEKGAISGCFFFYGQKRSEVIKMTVMFKNGKLKMKKWLEKTKSNYKNEFKAEPKTYLMIRNLHNNSETKYEYVD
ncbi:MAG: hypothetical protein RR965_08930, partial [Enterococcus sp.]